jgi:hypothetical protein
MISAANFPDSSARQAPFKYREYKRKNTPSFREIQTNFITRQKGEGEPRLRKSG